MTVPMTDEELAAERQQVEEVFGLGGGELNEPFEYTHPDSAETHRCLYWYDEPPEYAGDDFPDKYDATYRTCIWDQGSYGWNAPPPTLFIDGTPWEFVRSYGSSGERECPLRSWRPEEPHDARAHQVFEVTTDTECCLCGEQPHEEHGYICLGEGWCEAVYREVPDDDEDGPDDPEVADAHLDDCDDRVM